MKHLKITIHAEQAKQKELLRVCRMIVDETRQVAGCKECSQMEENIDENVITIECQWQHRHQLYDYFRSDRFSVLLGAIKVLGKHYEITIDDGSPEEGSTAVENARARNAESLSI